ncbi:putative uncharacterized protein [Waddlia chondrophila 2032/99]|uniref:Uncharacterized protein n=1 Tax=Waddlia chondrophila 2032/99 TaxID=765953 RepID=F8LDP1_9BACT|nr:putative uncharacterized protein [Waddlia chondrophila 2032/99]
MSIKKACALLVASIVMIVFFLPSILSTNWVKEKLLSSVNRSIKGSVQVEAINLSWFGPQILENVRLLGSDESVVASLRSISSDTSLFSLMFQRSSLGDTQIKELNAELSDSLMKSFGLPLRVKSSHPVKLFDSDFFFSGSPSDLKLTASGNTAHQGKQGSFSLNCDVSSSGNTVKANVIDFPVEILDVLAAANDPERYGMMSALLGDTLNVKINETSESGTSDLSVHLQADLFNIVLNGKLTSERFTLSSPVNTHLVITPAIMEQLMKGSSSQLVKPINVDIELKDVDIPFDFFRNGLSRDAARNASFELSVKIPQAEWQMGAVENIQLLASALKGHSSFDVSVSGSLKQENKLFPFVMKSLHQKPLTEELLLATIVQPKELSFTLNNLKTKTLDAYFGTGNHWQQIFGNAISLQVQSSDSDLQTMKMLLQSEKINVPNVVLKIDQPLQLETQRQLISGSIYSDAILFQKQKSSLESLKIKWKLDPAKKSIEANFTGKSAFAGSYANGLIEGSLFVDLGKEALKTTLEGKRVPAPLLSLITGRKEWEPVFGPVLDLNLKADMKGLTGPVKAEVDGANGRLELDGQLTKGVVTLNSPLRLSTHATQELGKDVLSDFAPVFGELISAESSINLTIDPDRFSMPLSMNFSEMHFKRAVLDLGKMTFRNRGDVHRLLDVLKADSIDQVEVWATPMYLEMDAGLLRIYRMDMLVMNRYPIAAWGQIHLPNDKVDMVLGISPVALAQSLGVTGLPKGYMLQIPIKGSSSNTKINSAKVMSRIGALVAQSSGGPEGFVLGTVLDLANGKEPKIPPPTTNPLPWGDLTVEMPQKKSSSSPVNEIKNQATKFFKGIFR